MVIQNIKTKIKYTISQDEWKQYQEAKIDGRFRILEGKVETPPEALEATKAAEEKASDDQKATKTK